MAGIYSGKPKPYSTPPMVKALRGLVDGKPIVSKGSGRIMEALKARGWVDRKTVTVTERGLKYLQEQEKK